MGQEPGMRPLLQVNLDHGIITGFTPTIAATEDFEGYAIGNVPTLDQNYGWDGAANVSNYLTATIGSEDFVSETGKQYLELKSDVGGPQGKSAIWARKMIWGNNWTRIRIGLLCQIPVSGFTSPGFNSTLRSLGVCNGPSLGYLDGTANWVGFSSVDVASGLIATGQFMQENGGGNPTYWQGVSSRGMLAAKQNVTFVSTAAFSAVGGFIAPSSVSPARRGAIFLDLIKGSPSYTAHEWDQDNGGNLCIRDVASETFWKQYDDTYPPQNLTALGAIWCPTTETQTLTIDESLGGFDTVSFSWYNVAQRPLRVFGIGVVRLY